MRRALVDVGVRLRLRARPSASNASATPSSATTATTAAAAARSCCRRAPLPLPQHHHQHQQQHRLVSSSAARSLPAAAPTKGGSGGGSGGQVMNEAIRTERVRLVIKDEATGKSTTEVVSRNAALAKARQMGLDLVLVSKASEPWVCKLLDFRKEEYLRQKKERQRSKATKAQTIKELAIRGNISDHDLLIKLRRVTDFFAQGLSVRLTLLPTSSQMSRRPLRLLELRDFILNDALANKTKSVVEIQPSSPTSQRRELILHPKRPPQQQQPQQEESGGSGKASNSSSRKGAGAATAADGAGGEGPAASTSSPSS